MISLVRMFFFFLVCCNILLLLYRCCLTHWRVVNGGFFLSLFFQCVIRCKCWIFQNFQHFCLINAWYFVVEICLNFWQNNERISVISQYTDYAVPMTMMMKKKQVFHFDSMIDITLLIEQCTVHCTPFNVELVDMVSWNNAKILLFENGNNKI